MVDSYELAHASSHTTSRSNNRFTGMTYGTDFGHGTEPKQASNVVLKFDLLLLPFLSLLFLVNSLDRTNIGNAETANFTKDIGLKPKDLNTALAIFYAVFVALQPVGAACGRRFGMVRWVPSCMVVWGLCTLLHVWVRRKWQFYTLRILIGCLEAGFYPVTVSYLSLFYTRFEFGKRLGFFYGQATVAGALGGLLSYVVFSAFPDRPDMVGLKSWQALFLVEGLATMVIAIGGYFWLPHSPETSWFLNAEERDWARERIRSDRASKQAHVREIIIEDNEIEEEEPSGTSQYLLDQSRTQSAFSLPPDLTKDSGLRLRDVYSALTEWKLWTLLLVNILSAIPSNAFAVFLPLIVRGFGWSPAYANLLSVPPFITAAFVLALAAWWSDRHKERLRPILYALALLLAGLSLTVMLPTRLFLIRYISLCLLLGGSYVASLLTVAWFADNMEEPGKRAIVLGINGWGNLAGVFSSLLFAPQYGPGYEIPFVVTLVLVIAAFTGYVLFRSLLVQENARREVLLSLWSEEEMEAERLHGRGPVQTRSGSGKVMLRVFGPETRVGVWLRECAAAGRRGDEKMTFVYGL